MLVYCFVCSEEMEISESEKAIFALDPKTLEVHKLGYGHELCLSNFELAAKRKIQDVKFKGKKE